MVTSPLEVHSDLTMLVCFLVLAKYVYLNFPEKIILSRV